MILDSMGLMHLNLCSSTSFKSWQTTKVRNLMPFSSMVTILDMELHLKPIPQRNKQAFSITKLKSSKQPISLGIPWLMRSWPSCPCFLEFQSCPQLETMTSCFTTAWFATSNKVSTFMLGHMEFYSPIRLSIHLQKWETKYMQVLRKVVTIGMTSMEPRHPPWF